MPVNCTLRVASQSGDDRPHLGQGIPDNGRWRFLDVSNAARSVVDGLDLVAQHHAMRPCLCQFDFEAMATDSAGNGCNQRESDLSIEYLR